MPGVPGPRPAGDGDVAALTALVNRAAEAYRGVIPADCWHEPYMPEAELRRDIAAGVRFWVIDEGGSPVAAMGLQQVRDVALIRHAYVSPERQRSGLGSVLLTHIRARSERPLLVGTWRAAEWAVAFYRRHGFRLLDATDGERLLRRYWTVAKRQREASVVLADERWSAPGTRGTIPPA